MQNISKLDPDDPGSNPHLLHWQVDSLLLSHQGSPYHLTLVIKKSTNIIYETSRQSSFDARYWMLGAGALGQPRGMVWGGRREEDSGWGTHVYLWQIHFDIWQNQYNIVKLKNKIKLKK